jgi:hypothetical protein
VTGQSTQDAIKELHPGNATRNLISDEVLRCRVYIQYEKVVATSHANVPTTADDIFIIKEGITPAPAAR